MRYLELGLHPRVPEFGSVGASGDLAPLAHVALSLLGEGEAEHGGEWIPGARPTINNCGDLSPKGATGLAW